MSACKVCFKSEGKLFACKGCKLAIYCSQNHATEDWPAHQSVCSTIGRAIPDWARPEHEDDPAFAAFRKPWDKVRDINTARWSQFHANTLVEEALTNAVDFAWNNNSGTAFYFIRFGSTPGQLVLVLNKVNLIRLMTDNGVVYVTNAASTLRQLGVPGIQRLSATVAQVIDQFRTTAQEKFGHPVKLMELSSGY
jgi:hypothetical protein